MSRARGQDVIGFTRIFVLFCTLVLAPALLMSGFGVIAIMNEREAVKQRRFEEATAALHGAERNLAAALDEADRALLAAGAGDPALAAPAVTRLRAAGHPIGPWILLPTIGAPTGEHPFTGQSALHDRLIALAGNAVRDQVVHVELELGEFAGIVSIQTVAAGVLLYAVDDFQLARQVQSSDDAALRTSLEVRSLGEQPVVGAMDRLLAELVEARTAQDSTSERIIERRLEPPFDRYLLVVDGSRSTTSSITTVAYIVLLVVFLATLITGVVITARLIWQETRISRLKTDFVSHISHELRTPLTSIRMFIDTLKLGRASSEVEKQECLDLLAKETERLSEMIERVLGYARLRAGRRLFSPQPVRVQSIVDAAIDAFRAHNLDPTRLTLTTDVAPNLPNVVVDRDAMVEALLNLIGNAYKYTGQEKQISVFAQGARRGRVVIGVKDNGPGLPASEHQRIFERFYQAKSLLSTKQTGSGLGLAITKAIVEGNGGRVFVESEPGKGATFFVELRPT
ncbi:MAG: two-component sensor histidine kinase [Deltaproteobacteria bacterium]|nr:two-component sensor histidine kinase [Deltaproteobacteria bacterium]